MSDDQSDLFVEETSTEDKFFGVKTTFDKKAKEEEATDIEFEVMDDRPEEDQRPQKSKKAEKTGDSESSDEELGQYSEKVQKRLNKLKFDYHEERRQREAAEKMREEAISYAQQVANKNQEMESLISRGEAALVEQVRERASVALDSARASYRKAYEEGNTDEIIASQERLNRAQAEYAEAERYQSQNRQQVQQRAQYEQQAYQQEIARRAAQQVAAQNQPSPSPRPRPSPPRAKRRSERLGGEKRLVHERRARGDDRLSLWRSYLSSTKRNGHKLSGVFRLH